MFQRIAQSALQTLSGRLLMAELIVMIPVALSTSWLAASINQALVQLNFFAFFLQVATVGTLTALVSTYLLVYPLERWVIRDRTAHSWRWLGTRALLYVGLGLPIGGLLLLGMRLGSAQYSPIVESSYFVTTVANLGVISLVHSFFERINTEVQRREAQLQQQITQLHIQIDEVKRAQQLANITETDYFQALYEKRQQLRARAGRLPVSSTSN